MVFDNRPIGLFDSGIGGLTVLKSLTRLLPAESFVYLGDTARLPYGSKSPETIERYLKQNIQFLKGLDVKAVVVACNSASTVLLGRDPAPSTIPIYNVIEPGARAALAASRGRRIGILGTKATIASMAYTTTLQRLEPSVQVFSQACPLLVPLVEEGWENDPLTNLIIYRYVQPLVELGVDTLVLGCTHYPVLKTGIQKVTGLRVALVDSAQAISESITHDIASGILKPHSGGATGLEILTTDVSPSFLEIARRLMAPVEITSLGHVDIGVARGERD